MAVLLGSARSDENKKAHGGRAGDQTGKEVVTQSWYLNAKGWYVLRADSPEAREKIAWCMEQACANDRIGYDQYQRDTLYNAVKDVGFDVTKLTKNVECDCSALVRVCCAYAGIMVGSFRTSNQVSILMATGAFTKFTDDLHCRKSSNLLRGDILVTRTQGHTVVVLSDGSNAKDEDPTEYEPGARTLRKGTVGNDVAAMQKLLLEQGYDLGSYGADGDFGTKTEAAVKQFQKDHGLDVTGICDTETLAAMQPAHEKIETNVPMVVIAAGTAVNIRAGNGTQYPAIGTAKNGATYEHVATAANGWNAIVADSQVGWVSGQYSRII